MIETICVNCRQRYPLGQDHVCQKPAAKKSTAARKDVRRATAEPTANEVKDPPLPEQIGTAGTQAPPVDTPKPKYKDRHKPGYQAQKQREYRARKKASNQP